MISDYYLLAKPGILFGNLMTAAAGFFLAAQHPMDAGSFFAMLSALACVMGSSCVLNNIIDRNIDALMERTKKRALACGAISRGRAFFFSLILLALGIFLLGFYTNKMALFLAVFGFVVYVAGYSFMKFKSPHATLVGSVAGAMPPLVGYVSAAGTWDMRGCFLFLVLVFWQMPHFYAIALFRAKEYAAASIPVLPLVSGAGVVQKQMAVYGLAFFVSLTGLHFLCGGKGLWVALAAGGLWTGLCCTGMKAKNSLMWARKVFSYSLVVIFLLSSAAAVNFFFT